MKFCTNCGNKIKEGESFCTACGSKVAEDKVEKVEKEEKVVKVAKEPNKTTNKVEKEKKVNEVKNNKTEKKVKEVKEEIKEEVKEEPVVVEKVIQEPVNYNNQPREPLYQQPYIPKKKNTGLIVFVSILITALVAAIVVLVILIINKNKSEKDDNSGNNNSNYSETINDNDQEEYFEPVEEGLVGTWTRKVSIKKGEVPVERYYSEFEFKKNGNFTYYSYDMNDRSNRVDIKGTYEEQKDKVIIEYEYDGEDQSTELYISDYGEMCVGEESCEEYFMRAEHESELSFDYNYYYGYTPEDEEYYYDEEELAVPYITLNQFYDLLEDEESAIVVFTKEDCAYCEQYAPVVEKLKKNKIYEVYYVEVDWNNKEFSALIEGTPATFIIKDGDVVKKLFGYQEYDYIDDISFKLGVW